MQPTPDAEATLENLRARIGREAHSEWHRITQDMVARYAELSGDGEGEWIHLDPERAAREAGYGGAIVQGFFQVSHLIKLSGEAMRSLLPFDTNHALNYGFDRLRFVRPMPVGARFRARVRIAEVTPKPGDSFLLKEALQLELEDGTVTLAADWLFFLGPRALAGTFDAPPA
ncbi:MaoC/PaaZ C-terminal domain-containing protein [Variovorax paradoxus]|uniref:MaoC/PaaZ C-terminal domain-containing protein n=1 Tax=Variovorax paradoxus TaxID=34073 RepID=UPI00193417BD|nr:MaoC family dehydratase N-terminal domain-containing protein [Variovorax paradoxus]